MDMKHNVLCLLHLPPPDYGVTLLNKSILDGCLRKHFYLDYLSINTSRKLEDIEKISPLKIVILLKIFFALFKKLTLNQYKICYFTLTTTGIGFYKDFFLVILLKVFKVKTIYHLHGKGISRRNNILDRILYSICFSNSRVIIMSKLLFYDIKKYVNRGNVYILPNGINNCSSGDISINRGVDGLNKDPVHLLFLSNMVKSKGIFIALEAAKILKTKGYDFIFSFAGRCYDISKKEFKDKMQEFALEDRVRYLGFKAGKDKFRLFKEGDIFVYPTYNDTFPLVILEAMQFALPVVSTYEGAIPEIVDDGITGYLVPSKDTEAVVEKLEILLNNKDLRISMGKAGRRKFLSQYTFDKFQQGLINIFNKVMDKR